MKDCRLRTPRWYETYAGATCPEPAAGEEAANSALAFLGMCALARTGSGIRISGGSLGISCQVRIAVRWQTLGVLDRRRHAALS